MNIIEYVINLLLSNMFIVVIIGGLILNVFQRFVEQSKERNQSPNKPDEPAEERKVGYPSTPIPNFPDFQGFPKRMKDEVKEKTKPKTESKPEINQDKQNEQLQNKLSTLKEKVAQTQSRKEVVKSMGRNQASSRTASTRQIKKSSQKRVDSLSIDGKKAVQGVIWSEILGPPKSKRQIYKR
ncbi:hypothetical protein [Metabacillus iocasae]|uniref:Uncharacterized protein n=1 Tax=Priestia iocasae TaxID=2291674 RepID=A0ABS2QQH8_9BACI|nr:hypothetical protein [Metabacillus iocasae]MBM7701478.1 hypothetical protein [Metabacillus iocasae]